MIFVKITIMSKDPRRKTLLFILASAVFLLGMADVNIKDIETAILKKDFERAQKIAAQFLAKSPPQDQSHEARYYLGISQLYSGEYEKGRETFQQLIADKPSKKLYDRVYLGMIDSFYMAGDYNEALKEARRLLKRRRHSEFLSLIYLKIAKANLKLAQWREATRYLNKIIQKFPNSFEFYIAQQLMEEEQYFSVQVGSFLDPQRSQDLVNNLNQQGQYAYTLEITDKKGRKFYRVRVGQLSRLRQARELKQKLSRLGYPTRIYP